MGAWWFAKMSEWRENNDRVEELLGEARKGSRTARLACPFCADEGHKDKKLSLVIWLANGRWKCYRCALWGRLRSLANEDFEDEFDEEEEDPEEFEKPAEFIPLAGDRSESLRPARAYLRSRGVPESIWVACNIHACDEGFWAERIIIPFLDPADERRWLGWIARLWRPKPRSNARGVMAMPYMYPADMAKGTYFWNHNAINRQTRKPVLIVEGAFDSFPHYPHVAACLGKPSQKQIAALHDAKRPVCIALDGDAWEEAHMLSCKLQFAGVQAGSLRLPAGADPAEISAKRMMRAAVKSIGRYEPVRL